jgi:hypothetical protein
VKLKKKSNISQKNLKLKTQKKRRSNLKSKQNKRENNILMLDDEIEKKLNFIKGHTKIVI